MNDDKWTIRESRRCWKDKNYATMTCYMGMEGRVPLGELIAHLAEHHPHIDPLAVELNYATAKWDDLPTTSDRIKLEASQRRQAERQEEWERETYERLKVKYANDQPGKATDD